MVNSYPYLDPSVPEETPEAPTGLDISQAPPNVSPRLPKRVTQTRAAKYDLALGDDSPGVKSIEDSLASGVEEPLRLLSANAEVRKRWEAAVEVFKTGEATVDGDTMMGVVDAAKKQVSPASSLENQ